MKRLLLLLLLPSVAWAQPAPKTVKAPDTIEITGTLDVEPFNPIMLTVSHAAAEGVTVRYQWRCVEAVGSAEAHRNDFAFRMVDSGATIYAWAPPADYEISCLIVTATADTIDIKEAFATVAVKGPRPPPVVVVPDPPVPNPTDTKAVVIIYDVSKTTAAHNSVLSDARLDSWTEEQGAKYLKILSKKSESSAGTQHPLVTKLLPSIPTTATLPHYFLLDESQNVVAHGDLPTTWEALKTILKGSK